MAYGQIYTTTDWGFVSESGYGSYYYNIIHPDPTPFNELLTEIGEYVMTEQDENIIVE